MENLLKNTGSFVNGNLGEPAEFFDGVFSLSRHGEYRESVSAIAVVRAGLTRSSVTEDQA